MRLMNHSNDDFRTPLGGMLAGLLAAVNEAFGGEDCDIDIRSGRDRMHWGDAIDLDDLEARQESERDELEDRHSRELEELEHRHEREREAERRIQRIEDRAERAAERLED